MPTLVKIERTDFWPAKWTLITTKGKKIFVEFQNKQLTCRYNSGTLGTKMFDKLYPKRGGSVSAMSTFEMLRLTRFKMDLDYYLVAYEKEQEKQKNDPQPQTDSVTHPMS